MNCDAWQGRRAVVPENRLRGSIGVPNRGAASGARKRRLGTTGSAASGTTGRGGPTSSQRLPAGSSAKTWRSPSNVIDRHSWPCASMRPTTSSSASSRRIAVWARPDGAWSALGERWIWRRRRRRTTSERRGRRLGAGVGAPVPEHVDEPLGFGRRAVLGHRQVHVVHPGHAEKRRPTVTAVRAPERVRRLPKMKGTLAVTGDPEADQLLIDDPARAAHRDAARPAGADGVGVPRAAPPQGAARRTLDAGAIAAMPVDDVVAVFSAEAGAAPLPGRRWPSGPTRSARSRRRTTAATPAHVWNDAATGAELFERLSRPARLRRREGQDLPGAAREALRGAPAGVGGGGAAVLGRHAPLRGRHRLAREPGPGPGVEAGPEGAGQVQGRLTGPDRGPPRGRGARGSAGPGNSRYP